MAAEFNAGEGPAEFCRQFERALFAPFGLDQSVLAHFAVGSNTDSFERVLLLHDMKCECALQGGPHSCVSKCVDCSFHVYRAQKLAVAGIVGRMADGAPLTCSSTLKERFKNLPDAPRSRQCAMMQLVRWRRGSSS
eukprot:2086145-Amphidinium_carterae.1